MSVSVLVRERRRLQRRRRNMIIPLVCVQNLWYVSSTCSIYFEKIKIKTSQPSPFDKFRNVALRKPSTHTRNTRTPSLSRTTPSPTSSSSLDSNGVAGSGYASREDAGTGSVVNMLSIVVQGPEDEVDGEGGEEGEGVMSDLQKGGYMRFENEEEGGGGGEQEKQGQQGEHEQEESHEPTFSSIASSPRSQYPPRSAPPPSNNTATNPPRAHSPVPSSPGTSLAFTPTPANPPRARPRARREGFPLPVPALNAENEDEGGEGARPRGLVTSS